MAEHPRLWGIDIVSAVYGIGALLMLLIIQIGSSVGQVFGVIMTPICVVLAIGIFRRSNPIRVILVVLLCIGIVGDVLLALYFIAGLSDFVSIPPNKDPVEELAKMPTRLAFTFIMLFYLRRPDVRKAFAPSEPSIEIQT